MEGIARVKRAGSTGGPSNSIIQIGLLKYFFGTLQERCLRLSIHVGADSVPYKIEFAICNFSSAFKHFFLNV